MENNWYEFNGIDHLDTPALVVYPDRVISNIEMLKAMVPSKGLLRPHVKTNKCGKACQLMIRHGISKFKCATLAEAAMLGRELAEDVLLAYQPTKSKLEGFIKIIRSYPETRFSCLLDNAGTARLISGEAQKAGICVNVYIDLNVGMNRTGIKPEQALELFLLISSLRAIECKGFHAYDGHIRDVNITERAAHCEADFASVEVLRQNIVHHGHLFPLLIAGGTPTFQLHSKRKNVECSPGTFIFWDKGYSDSIPDQSFSWAALVICRVISLPDEIKICVDLGYKSISSENDLQNRVHFLNASHLVPYSHSEEHMTIDAGLGHTFKIGDVLYALPVHICPTVAMYDNAMTVINGILDDNWPINARGRTAF